MWKGTNNEYIKNVQFKGLPRMFGGKRFIWFSTTFLIGGYATLLRRGSLVYFALCFRAHDKKQTCYPSYETIMRESGIKNRNVITRVLNTLEYLRLIEIARFKGKVSNRYLLLDNSAWKKLDYETTKCATKIMNMTFKQYKEFRINDRQDRF